MLWACSKLGYTEPVVLRRLAAAAVAAGPRMNGQVRAGDLVRFITLLHGLDRSIARCVL